MRRACVCAALTAALGFSALSTSLGGVDEPGGLFLGTLGLLAWFEAFVIDLLWDA